MDITSLNLFAFIAYRCLCRERKERPLMIEIVKALESALEIQENADEKADEKAAVHFDAKNHYVILYVSPLTDYHPLAVKAEWNEESTLYVENFVGQELVILINKVESQEKHRHVATARYKFSDLTPEIKTPYFLNVERRFYFETGDHSVEVLYKPSAYQDHIFWL
ncbi:hypothetical protein HanIR_Chr02g0085581 [Helianthus annuus]|nr:hypothetical protein HanIR_Chr02g0085581 [Helianthus annuus]